ncbi:MAG: hypothetical protein IKA74_06075 [Clostridia bacterium]|jgi:hypothetical protein|nr:hypothetical protein [Clostridia bacterium]
MKRFFAFSIALILLLATLMTMASCSSFETEDSEKPFTNPIDFGKKYIYQSSYYVFEENQTGYLEHRYEYVDTRFPTSSFTRSGRVEFVWREASDGAVYLFRTATHYNEEHTQGHSIPFISSPIYFSEEFFSTTQGDSTTRFIKEGSALENLIEK